MEITANNINYHAIKIGQDEDKEKIASRTRIQPQVGTTHEHTKGPNSILNTQAIRDQPLPSTP
jgi:hypothetical protein